MLSILKSPVKFSGLFFVLLLPLCGCESGNPEGTTTKFWQALAQGQINIAKKQATQNSQNMVTLQDIDTHSAISTGQVTINELDAMVETTISRNNKPITFNTVLLKEQGSWKVDFQQTHTNIAMIPFEGIVKSLENLGDSLTKELEEAVPQIEKEIESMGNELKEQLDEFGRSLKKPQDPYKPKPHPNTI